MRYPIVIHKDPDSDYGVTMPDLPGCFSAGGTWDEALTNVVEAIELHLEGMLKDNEPAPPPKPIEVHQRNPDYVGGVWALVTVDLSRVGAPARRVNVALPEPLLTIVDRYASQHGESRAGVIAQAAMEFIAGHQEAERE